MSRLIALLVAFAVTGSALTQVDDCQACRDLNGTTLHLDIEGIANVSASNCNEMVNQTKEECEANWPKFINVVCGESKENCTESLIKIYTDLKSDFEKDGSDIEKFCQDKKFCSSSRSIVLFVVLPLVAAFIILIAVILAVYLYKKKQNGSPAYNEF